MTVYDFIQSVTFSVRPVTDLLDVESQTPRPLSDYTDSELKDTTYVSSGLRYDWEKFIILYRKGVTDNAGMGDMGCACSPCARDDRRFHFVPQECRRSRQFRR